MTCRFPGESEEYRAARDRLLARPGPTAGKTAALPLGDGPCPSCTALLDQLDGAVEHVEQHLSFAVVAKAPIERVLAFAEERGWRRLRFVSSAGTTFNRDYFGETPEGAQRPIMNVFQREHAANGAALVRHFWSSELLYAPIDPDQDPRHVGTLEPSWNMFDMTREGRGATWDEQIDYCCARAR